MSTWTEATDAFCAKVEATIGSATARRYVAIPEAIDLEEGGELFLRKGYAIDIGGANRRAQSVKQLALEDRTYLITLTREVNRTATNTDSRKSLKEEMLEDAESLRVAFDADHILGGCVIDTNWQSDSGITEFLEGDRDKYYIMGIQYTMTIEFR